MKPESRREVHSAGTGALGLYEEIAYGPPMLADDAYSCAENFVSPVVGLQ
jgi:hypothetical protein